MQEDQSEARVNMEGKIPEGAAEVWRYSLSCDEACEDVHYAFDIRLDIIMLICAGGFSKIFNDTSGR